MPQKSLFMQISCMLRDVRYHLSFFEKSFESLFDHSHLFISRKDVMTEIFHLVSQSNKDIVFNCKLLQNQLNLFNVSAMFGQKRIHLDLADRVFPGNGCWEMPRWGNLSLGRVLIAWACKVSLMISFAFLLSEYSSSHDLLFIFFIWTFIWTGPFSDLDCSAWANYWGTCSCRIWNQPCSSGSHYWLLKHSIAG